MALYQDPFAANAELAAQADPTAGLEALYAPQPVLPAQRFDPGLLGSLIENLAGLQQVQPPHAPRSFGQGLAVGAAQGLGGAGSRVAAARSRFDALQEKRQQARDEANLKATDELRSKNADYLTGLSKEQRKAVSDAADYTRDNVLVTPLDAQEHPELDLLVGHRVPASKYAELVSKPSPKVASEQKRLEAYNSALGTAQGKAAGPADTVDEQLLSPQAMKKLVELRLAGGPDPSFGMGKTGVKNKTAYYNALGAAPGTGGDIAQGIADLGSERQSLSNLTKIHSAASAFEETALKNTKILEKTLTGLPDLGSSFLNRPLRAIASGTGSKEMARFNTARQTVVPEFTRLLNSPTAAGVISDSARHEMQVIIDPNATVGQILEAIAILKQDATNRTRSYQDAIDQSKARIRLIGTGRSLPSQIESGGQFNYDAQGNRIP